ncbi:MAG: hypothetical protein HQ508_08055 [Candidatus Marinimicrobia bacterium]|nr:hypothetical protein [Candidatus Neomarinimicrobiota bacterium]
MPNRFLLKVLALLAIISFAYPQNSLAEKFKLPDLNTFISDTLKIQVPVDSTLAGKTTDLMVIDSRALDGDILGIRQTKKVKYIPVDQYLALNQSLADLFQARFVADSLELTGTLHVSKLILWWDGSPLLDKGLCLNAYTTYHDTSGAPLNDWLWEIRLKKEKKEEEAAYLSRFVQELIKQQSEALAKGDFNSVFYPHLYRRQLMSWSEFIFFKDGYGVNVHFTLDFPPDQKSSWKRGSPGLFYRKSDIHESISIGGKDQQWYRRLSPDWIAKTSTTFRFGFNNFEGGHFDHLEYQNLLYVNVSGQASLEYRPVYHKGLYAGLGLYTGYNILPDVIPQFELGLLLSLGVILP